MVWSLVSGLVHAARLRHRFNDIVIHDVRFVPNALPSRARVPSFHGTSSFGRGSRPLLSTVTAIDYCWSSTRVGGLCSVARFGRPIGVGANGEFGWSLPCMQW